MGLYVHVPFCLRHCPYCDFTVAVVSEIPHRDYLNAVAREITRRRGDFDARELTTIYFGGGTPGLWNPDCVAAVIEHAASIWGLDALREVTVEMNPELCEPDRLARLRAAGVTRISLGIQSFDPAALRALGRAHDGEAAHAACARVLEAGFEHVSIDLIYAVPGIDASAELRSVRRLEELGGIDHVSLYELTIEPRTAFGAAARRGALRPFRDDAVVERGTQLLAALRAAGFERYEVSSLARGRSGESSESSRSAHNLGYWRGDEYLGVGVGAHSLRLDETGQHAVRAANDRRLSAYLRAGYSASAGGRENPANSGARSAPRRAARSLRSARLRVDVEHISPKEHLAECLFLGMRQAGGPDIRALGRRFAVDLSGLSRLVELWRDRGWIRGAWDALAVTDDGMWQSDAIALQLVEWVDEQISERRTA